MADIPLPIIKRAKEKSKEAQKEMESLEFRNISIKVLRNIMQKKDECANIQKDVISLSAYLKEQQ